jgi:hypothetical protein
MRIAKASGLLAVVGGLAFSMIGCSSPEASSPTASPSESSSPSQSPTLTVSPSETQSASPSDCLTQEEAVSVLSATDAATSVGFTERYFGTDGSEWVLILNPAQEDDYTAAWFDTKTGEGELVYDGLTFSYMFGLVALSQDTENDELYFYEVQYLCQDGGFSVISINPQDGNEFGYRFYVSSEGLLASANQIQEGVETGNVVQYEYSVEQRWIDGLDALVEELLSDF